MYVLVGGSYLVTSQVHQGEALRGVRGQDQASSGGLCANPAVKQLQQEAEKEAAPNPHVMAHVGLGTCVFKGPSTQQSSLCCAGRVNRGTPGTKPRFHPSSRGVVKRGSHLHPVLCAPPQPYSGSPVERCHLPLVKPLCSQCRTPPYIQVGSLSTQPSSCQLPPSTTSRLTPLSQTFGVFLLRN